MKTLVCLLLLAVVCSEYVSCSHPYHHNKLHRYHHQTLHNVQRRSTQTNKKFAAPISSFVEDVSESTAFNDREKKLNSLEHAGELYKEHSVNAYKRKYVSHPKKPDIDNNDDDYEDDDQDTETTTGSKKHEIFKDNTDASEKIDSSMEDDEVDDESDGNNDEESGSGDADDVTTNNEKDDDDGDDDTTNGDQKSGKLKCRKKCSIPMTFHKCAFPRCSKKMGTIKDLCFYLCKHQKERCEDVCE